jgi:hypothetical protein
MPPVQTAILIHTSTAPPSGRDPTVFSYGAPLAEAASGADAEVRSKKHLQ